MASYHQNAVYEVIYTPEVILACTSQGVDFTSAINRLSTHPQCEIAYFDDGSVSIVGEPADLQLFYDSGGLAFQAAALEEDQRRSLLDRTSITGTINHRGVHLMPQRFTQILIWGEYVRKIKGSHIVVTTSRIDGRLRDWDPENMIISIAFCRKICRETNRSVAEQLEIWRASADCGVKAAADIPVHVWPRHLQIGPFSAESSSRWLTWLALCLRHVIGVNVIEHMSTTRDTYMPGSSPPYFVPERVDFSVLLDHSSCIGNFVV